MDWLQLSNTVCACESSFYPILLLLRKQASTEIYHHHESLSCCSKRSGLTMWGSTFGSSSSEICSSAHTSSWYFTALATLPLVVSFNFLLVLSKVGFDLHLLVVLVFLSWEVKVKMPTLCFHLQTWGPFTSPWNTFFSWPPEYHILSTLVHPHRFFQLSSPLSPPHLHHF